MDSVCARTKPLAPLDQPEYFSRAGGPAPSMSGPARDHVGAQCCRRRQALSGTKPTVRTQSQQCLQAGGRVPPHRIGAAAGQCDLPPRCHLFFAQAVIQRCSFFSWRSSRVEGRIGLYASRAFLGQVCLVSALGDGSQASREQVAQIAARCRAIRRMENPEPSSPAGLSTLASNACIY